MIIQLYFIFIKLSIPISLNIINLLESMDYFSICEVFTFTLIFLKSFIIIHPHGFPSQLLSSLSNLSFFLFLVTLSLYLLDYPCLAIHRYVLFDVMSNITCSLFNKVRGHTWFLRKTCWTFILGPDMFNWCIIFCWICLTYLYPYWSVYQTQNLLS